MNQRWTRTTAALAASAALLTGGAVLAAESPPPVTEPTIPAHDSGEQGPTAGGAEASTNCRATFLNGSGIGTFDWCYSDDGSIAMLEHGEGQEHVANGTITEGWCVSANGTKRGQTSGAGANEGLSAPTYRSNNRVIHYTLDGSLKVRQKFSDSNTNKKILIEMQVTNRTGGVLGDVYLTRFIDPDLNNTTGSDVWASANRSVAVYEPGDSRLELNPKATKYPANSMIFDSFLPNLNEFCYDPAADTTVEAPAGDRSMGVLYQLGSLNPGETKTVKYFYDVSS